MGPSGVGKSHLAQALGHEACRRGYEVLFLSASRMLAQLSAGRADGTYERKLAALTRPRRRHLRAQARGADPAAPAHPR